VPDPPAATYAPPVASLAGRGYGAGDILDGAGTRMRATAAPLLSAGALAAAPAGLLAATAPLWPAPARIPVVVVPLTAGAVLGLAAAVLLLGDAGLGLRPSAPRALSRAARRFPALLGLLVLAAGQVGLGLLAVVLPGLTRLGGAQAALPVLLLEEVGPREALRRSRLLLAGQEGLALRAQAAAAAAAAAVAALPVVLVAVVVPLPPGGSQALAATRLLLAGLLLATLVLPVLAAVAFVLFVVRREQLEALDLQLALQALDDATPRLLEPAGAAGVAVA